MNYIKILLVLFAVTINFEIYELINVGTTGVTTNDILTIIITIIFLKITIWDGKEIKIAKNPAILFYGLFLFATLISGIYPVLTGNSLMVSQYFKTIVHFHFTCLIGTILILYKFENETWDKFIKIWLILSIIINVFGVYQIIARAFDLPFAWIDLTNAAFFSRNQNQVAGDDFTQLSLKFENFYRATSFFSEPSALGAYNGLTLIFALIPKIKGFKTFLKSNVMNNIVIVLCIIGLLLAFSMTGATIVIVILLIILFNDKPKVFYKVLKILPILILFIIVANILVDNYLGISILDMFGKRFGSLSNLLLGSNLVNHGIDGESIFLRGENFSCMFNIWQSSPIIGIGLGCTYLSPYANGWAFSDTSSMAAFAELGLVGAIPYISIFITFFILGYILPRIKSKIKSNDINSKRLISLMIYIAGYMSVTNFVSGNNLSNISSLFFIGFLISVSNNYYIDYEEKYYILKFVNRPLKYFFINRMKIDN